LELNSVTDGSHFAKPDSDSSGDAESTDAILVARCANGNAAAWKSLVDRFGPLVYSIGLRSGLGPDLRDDVFQATFLALHKNIKSLRDGQALAKWIITTASRESWRVAKAASSSPSEAEPAILDVQTQEKLEEVQRVTRAISKLGGKCEELLRLLFTSRTEPDYESVSVLLDMPIGSIGPTRSRCLAKLAELLEPSE
jgi:RNA polymerase sigma factor (sigma-70 family)